MYNEEYDFDTEFMADDEVEEMLDSLLLSTAEQVAAEESATSIIDPHRIQCVLYTYKVLKYLTQNMKGVKVSYTLHKPYVSVGYVSVVGRNLVFRKPEWFAKAAELADNFEAYPKTDGTVQINFTFHGLTNPIE